MPWVRSISAARGVSLPSSAKRSNSAARLVPDATRATTLAQTYVNREVMKIADNGLQVFGGHGFIREYPVEMWYRNARALTVTEAVCAL